MNKAEMANRIAYLECEVDGYKRAVQAAAETDGKTVVVLVWEGSVMKVFGPTPDREQAFAETVARWIKLVQVVSDDLQVKDARKKLNAISKVLKADAEKGSEAVSEAKKP